MADQTAKNEGPAPEAPAELPKIEAAPAPKAQAAAVKHGGTPDFGPNSKVRWDDPKNDPTKRLSVAEDPTGQKNKSRQAEK